MYRDPNLLYSICRVNIPSLNINDTAIERVTEYNFLGYHHPSTPKMGLAYK